jgi:hypothetical protein
MTDKSIESDGITKSLTFIDETIMFLKLERPDANNQIDEDE